MDTIKNLLVNGKSLHEYKEILEDSLTNFQQHDMENYVQLYEIICESDIPLDSKKALILALIKSGIPVQLRHPWYDAVFATLKKRDLPLLVFLLKKTPMTIHNGRKLVSECQQMGKNEENNQFIINLFNKISTTTTIQKAFLGGAIEGRNDILIRYIVEVVKPDLYIPTSQKSSSNALCYSLAHSDLETLKYLEAHGYNIHECQRELLNFLYRKGRSDAQPIIEYILSEQAKSSASNEYTEKIANTAFDSNNVELLEKFHHIKLKIGWTHVIDILKSDKPLIVFKTALERYLERETEINKRYDKFWVKLSNGQGYKIITTYHVNQVWKLAKDKKPIWDCFKQCIVNHAEDADIAEANKKDGTLPL